jgi:hypothetical protein
VEEAYAVLGRLSGGAGLRFSVDYFRREQAMLAAELPEAVAGAAIDGLLVDQLSPAAGTVAETLGLPFITICNALLDRLTAPLWRDLQEQRLRAELADPSGREPLLRDAVPFPWERLDGRPLIDASLGTLQNGRPELFAQIAEACAPLEAQLVISLGNPTSVPVDLPGNPIVVAYAPHKPLIERATLVLSHAG